MRKRTQLFEFTFFFLIFMPQQYTAECIHFINFNEFSIDIDERKRGEEKEEAEKSRLHNLLWVDKEKGNLHVWLTECLDWNTPKKKAIKTENEWWLCRGIYALRRFAMLSAVVSAVVGPYVFGFIFMHIATRIYKSGRWKLLFSHSPSHPILYRTKNRSISRTERQNQWMNNSEEKKNPKNYTDAHTYT